MRNKDNGIGVYQTLAQKRKIGRFLWRGCIYPAGTKVIPLYSAYTFAVNSSFPREQKQNFRFHANHQNIKGFFVY